MIITSTKSIKGFKSASSTLKNRFEYLDSLRGLAAMVVVASHFIGGYELPSSISIIKNTPLRILWDGQASVTLFFVLSGFVLSYKYFKEDNSMNGFFYPSYIISRVFRILPLFIVVLVSSAIIRNFFFFKDPTLLISTEWLLTFWQYKVNVIQVLKESFLLIRLPEESYLRLIPQDWTLTGELKQSLILPIFIFIGLRSKWILLALVFIIMFLSPYNQILFFYLGIVIAQNLPAFSVKWLNLNVFYKIALLFTALLLYSSYYLLEGIFADIRIVGIGGFMIISITLCSKKIQYLLSSRLLLFLGKVSYGIYLIHFTILISFIPFFTKYLNTLGIVKYEVVYILSYFALSIFSILISYFMYFLIEIRGIKLGKKISRLIETRAVFQIRNRY